ncbi:MAG: glutaminyl-peptide cyclotransferase [Planctomycetota bacterium]|nr:glutaminyl-peptide cyclotransferase [Planctomycetota bacterium]
MAKETKRKKKGAPQPKVTTSPSDRMIDDQSIPVSSNRRFLWFIFGGIFFGSMAVQTYLRIPPSTAPVLTYEVVNEYEHDATAFTQGLLIDNGRLYESTGRLKESTIRLVEIASGNPIIKKPLPASYFAEGITVYRNKIYQLTFQNKKMLVYNKDSLELIEERDFPFDGWGLTSDSDYLIHSDGTSTIRFLDPDTFTVVEKITVRDGKRKISEINELEYYDKRIYANVWHEDYILQIIPATGRVSARIELEGLLNPPSGDKEACLNGIAVDEKTNTFYLTGKLWPKVFEVKFVEKTK